MEAQQCRVNAKTVPKADQAFISTRLHVTTVIFIYPPKKDKFQLLQMTPYVLGIFICR